MRIEANWGWAEIDGRRYRVIDWCGARMDGEWSGEIYLQSDAPYTEDEKFAEATKMEYCFREGR